MGKSNEDIANSAQDTGCLSKWHPSLTFLGKTLRETSKKNSIQLNSSQHISLVPQTQYILLYTLFPSYCVQRFLFHFLGSTVLSPPPPKDHAGISLIVPS